MAEPEAVAAPEPDILQADVEHKMATASCLTQPESQLRDCLDRADAAYETAKAGAGVSRISRLR